MYFSGIADEAGVGIEAQIETHRELGWNHIELRLVNGVNVCQLPENDFEKVKTALNKGGMKVSAFASAIGNWSRAITDDFEVDRQELETAIPRMKDMDVQFIRVMSWKGEGADEKDWGNEALRRFKELAARANEESVVLALENCSGYANLSPEHFVNFIKQVDSPALKALYDTGNPAAYGYETWPYYKALKPYIAYVHIKANVGRNPDGSEGRVTSILMTPAV